ncbi:MAG: 30S ribosomal protein S6 [Patescibacteria group bacterium]
MSQHYHLLYITAPASGDEATAALQKQVGDVLVKAGAVLTTHDLWGVRKLGYALGRLKQGVYHSAEFDSESAAVRQIDRALHLMPEVVRYLIVKKELKTPEQLAEEKRIREKIQERKVHQAHVAAAAAQEKEKHEQQQTAAAQQAEIGAPKVSLEELDKKLDELLNDENI